MDCKAKARELVAQMTLEEKASLTSGKNFWNLKSIERLGIPEIMVTDGPHGLRKQAGSGDHLGIQESVPAVCFPTASATACTFDRALMHEIGVALGEECRQESVSVLLGPAVNMKRSPLCGRNFEYISEDPYLAGELGAALVQGIQSQGVGVSMKHYAANSQETLRMSTDSVIDERALREIYLPAFETVVKNADPWTLMCCYNLVNGTYGSDNKKLLTDILRDEWGFNGLVMTDWGAMNDRIQALIAGLDLQMPSDGGANDKLIVEAVNAGKLDVAVLDKAAVNVTDLILRSAQAKPMKYDCASHRALARKAAAESAVLLKNEDAMLPLKKGASVAVIGAFAKKPRYQGAGSSKIEPVQLDCAFDALTAAGVTFDYADGYALKSRAVDQQLIDEACAAAKGKDRVYLLAGLPEEYESEGFDRKNLDMPDSHNKLIEAVAAVNPNVCVLLICGAPVVLPWIDKVKGLLLCYLGGEAGGAAIADMITGAVLPGGRLGETWPLSLADTPAANYFPGYPKSVEYRESLFIGYRYFTTAKKAVQFPFGFGISGTTFAYSDLTLSAAAIKDTDTLTATVTVKNTGDVAADEVVQLYVSRPNTAVFRPEVELRQFARVSLKPGESKEVSLKLGKRAFAFYNAAINDWQVEGGVYEIRVGASCVDLRASATVTVTDTVGAAIPDYRETAAVYYDLSNGIGAVPDSAFVALLGRPLPPRDRKKGDPFTPNSTFSDIEETWVGRLIGKQVKKQMLGQFGGGMSDDIATMVNEMFTGTPLRFVLMSGDPGANKILDGILTAVNGKPLKGLMMMSKK